MAFSGMILFKGKEALTQTNEQKAVQEARAQEQRFKEEWIKSLLKSIDEQLDEKTRAAIMEACGRDCARRWAIRLAEACKGDARKFVEAMAKGLGKENNYLKGNVAHLGYNKCLCNLVAEGPQKLSDTYCLCSKGWVLEMFEKVTQKPVKVELLQSIKRGAPSCKFLIHI